MTAIVLAHEPDFALGPLTVVPSSRELVSADGVRHVIEPRVMQVLVALARAGGAVVSKDDLLASCWEGRVVGEDAINRVLSRLRRVAEEAGHGAFRIETVTRVGYRLLTGEAAQALETSGIGRSPTIPRRTALALVGVAGVVVAGGGAAWIATRRSPEALLLSKQADDALRYGTPEQTAVGVGALRRLVELEPERAEGWARLALAYTYQAFNSPPGMDAALAERAREARNKALALDPGNATAHLVSVIEKSPYRRWSAFDRDLRRFLDRFPDHSRGILHRSYLLQAVGRVAEALDRFLAVDEEDRSGPGSGVFHVAMLVTRRRLDEADALLARLSEAWPQHSSVWFMRGRHLMYSGRAPEVLAMLAPGAPKPIGIPQWNFDLVAAEARAVDSGTEDDYATAMSLFRPAMKIGLGFIQNAIIFTAWMGRTDESLRLADELYFGRSTASSRRTYSQEQGVFNPSDHRPTHFLFYPNTANLRAAPGFTALTAGLGLEEFWRRSGVQPDYRRSAAGAPIPA